MQKKVLIVDDHYGIRSLLRETFQEEGFETFEAANGVQALSILKEKKPDFVLLDLKITNHRMDGIEILQRMKKFDKAIKIMIMTAYEELSLINKAHSLGAIKSFMKPFQPQTICSALKQYVNDQQHHRYGNVTTA
ncbi:response regulator [Bacillus taeanensis]|uniref:Response regulator n=1 Tax=Bacillus taeanensis TaxID=273032 RepID=A0A366XZG7_9BACI|nr:response regulator [Bacillus taeanensis]RBW69543.1 response regulator [Bacillus taeanensis]